MDTKKVTRRSVIGTAVGGIAAAPFIIHALRGRYQADVPLGEYGTEWAKQVKMTDVPIREADGPSPFTLDCTPQVGEAFRVVSLSASYDEHTYPAKYPQTPYWYTVTNGHVAAVSPIVDAKPALAIDAGPHVTRSQMHSAEEPGGKCILVPSHDGNDYFVMRHEKPEPVKESGLGFARATIAKSLTFNYPRGESLAIGQSWTIPESGGFGFAVPCVVDRFSQVAGRETAKVMASRELSNEEVRQAVVNQTDELTQVMSETRGPGFDATSAVKSYLDQIVEDERTQALRITAYLDLKTGIAVRQEHAMTTHFPKEHRRDQTHIAVVQMFES